MWAAPRGRVFTSEVNYHGFMEMSASVHLKTSLIIKFWCRTVATLIFSECKLWFTALKRAQQEIQLLLRNACISCSVGSCDMWRLNQHFSGLPCRACSETLPEDTSVRQTSMGWGRLGHEATLLETSCLFLLSGIPLLSKWISITGDAQNLVKPLTIWYDLQCNPALRRGDGGGSDVWTRELARSLLT